MSSEEVLLTVGHVRNHKTDGTLYLMGERMAWMQGSKDYFSVSHAYSDIKTQKISPESKDKVQLQVVLHDGGANTFHFNNPMGRAQQTEDRNSIKEILQQLLPNFRRKISSELEEKNRWLQQDPELFQLYKDLVVSQVISAEEFWANRANKVQNAKKNDQQQTVGVSAAFLADIKPQTDGCNGLKYNLTVDVIESIFRTYPMVKKKHAECVPHTLTESEFWTRFFQSHYFHRDRINISSKDMFSDCAKNDDEDLKKAIEKKVSVPKLDLTNMNDGLNEPVEIRGGTNHVNLSMIRRFNHHSTMVLKAIDMQDGSQEGGNSSSTQTMQSSNIPGTSIDGGIVKLHNGVVNSHNNETETGPPAKKAKMSDIVDYEDLKLQDCDAGPSLNLTKMERYLHGPTTVIASRYNTSEDVLQAGQVVASEISGWTPNLTQVLSGPLALGAMGELSPGGLLMHGTSNQQLQQMVPADIQDELRQQYNALCELLRHFWTCFPTSTKFLEEKVVKMRQTLERFQMAKLNPLKEKLASYHYSVNLTGHLEDMLSAAYIKFDAWQSKKLNKRS